MSMIFFLKLAVTKLELSKDIFLVEEMEGYYYIN